eukprot:364557-Chlamydomonas_euryale.AAC.3
MEARYETCTPPPTGAGQPSCMPLNMCMRSFAVTMSCMPPCTRACIGAWSSPPWLELPMAQLPKTHARVAQGRPDGWRGPPRVQSSVLRMLNCL